jgi:hypothetical protein
MYLRVHGAALLLLEAQSFDAGVHACTCMCILSIESCSHTGTGASSSDGFLHAIPHFYQRYTGAYIQVLWRRTCLGHEGRSADQRNCRYTQTWSWKICPCPQRAMSMSMCTCANVLHACLLTDAHMKTCACAYVCPCRRGSGVSQG